LDKVEGLTDIKVSLETGNPELKIVFDRQKLALLGMTIESVSETLTQRVTGSIVSRFQQPDRQIDIRLRNREGDRENYNDIENMVVGESSGRPITLSAVAEIISGQGPAAIDRIQQARVVVVSANLKQRSLAEISQEIKQLLTDTPPPSGIVFEFGGQQEEMEKSFSSMIFAIVLAIFLVYLVMASTFEHLIHPFVILLTVPMALIGVIIGLYVSGYSISVIALIGAVFLVGVVVNNAIVLVDSINQMRRSGLEKLTAIIEASKSRLRPILMTSCTTILGLLPMAIGVGEGAELRAPLGIVVSYGLFFSMILTLFIIPCVYLIMPSKVTTYDDLKDLDERVMYAENLQVAEQESHSQTVEPDSFSQSSASQNDSSKNYASKNDLSQNSTSQNSTSKNNINPFED
jgi:HAE1 family hydrophobic/amphiphilic exporter-1